MPDYFKLVNMDFKTPGFGSIRGLIHIFRQAFLLFNLNKKEITLFYIFIVQEIIICMKTKQKFPI